MELIDAAADSGAEKHWRRMRCDSPAIARGFIVQMLRRSWGMAAFRANARLVTRRLQHIRGTAVPMYADPLSRARRRFRRRRDYASEQYGRNRRSEGLPRGGRCGPHWLFAGGCACSVYFVISNLHPPPDPKKKNGPTQACLYSPTPF